MRLSRRLGELGRTLMPVDMTVEEIGERKSREGDPGTEL